MSQLRAMPAEQLLSAAGSMRDRTLTFWPHVDGHFLPDTPESIFASGGQARVPLLIGNHLQERHFSAVLSDAEPTPENWRMTADGSRTTTARREYS